MNSVYACTPLSLSIIIIRIIIGLVKARPAFAHVLSACLRSAAIENTEEAWVELFMLPKCVLLTPKRGGRHHKPVSIDKLCELWSQGHIDILWQRATSHTSVRPSKAMNCDYHN